jgi:hypothetical protein
MYSRQYRRPRPPDDDGWRATCLRVFAIIGLLGLGSVGLIAKTVHAADAARAEEGESRNG